MKNKYDYAKEVARLRCWLDYLSGFDFSGYKKKEPDVWKDVNVPPSEAIEAALNSKAISEYIDAN